MSRTHTSYTRAFFNALDDVRRGQAAVDQGIAQGLSWMLGAGHEDKLRAQAVLEEEAPKIHKSAYAWATQDDRDDEWAIRRAIQHKDIALSPEILVVVAAVRTLRDEALRLHECRLPVNLKCFPKQLAKVVDAARAFNGHLARLQLQAATKPEHKKRAKTQQAAPGALEAEGVPAGEGVT